MNKKYLFSILPIMMATMISVGLISCGSDDDDNDSPISGDKQTNMRLASIDGQQLVYDDAGNVVSIKTSRWGNVMPNITATLDGSYLSQLSEGGESFSVSWSNSNPSSMSGHDFKSVATYGESCNSTALCMAFNLYAMMYGDAYKTHLLGVLYGYSLKGKFGKNANKLVNHLEYHETDDDEYDDMMCDYTFDKDKNGLVTQITMKIKTNSYKHGELRNSKEKTQTINLVWEELSNDDNNSQEEIKLQDKTPSGVTAVDLGLSVKWASCNIGATKPEECGLFFAWGETIGYSSSDVSDHTFDWKNYEYSKDDGYTLTKYCYQSKYGYNGFTDGLRKLKSEDDAATVNWGSLWRIPTRDEWIELANNTTSKWTILNGVKGRTFTSMTNGNVIFLPAAGRRSSDFLTGQDSEGYYCTSFLFYDYMPSIENYGHFDVEDVNFILSDRCYGASIRAVMDH